MDSREAINFIFNKNSEYVNSYKQDFLTDAYTLGMYNNTEPNLPFIHIAYESGTTLMPLHCATFYPDNGISVPFLFSTAERDNILTSVLDIVQYWNDSKQNFILSYYNGMEVNVICIEYAIILCKEYIAGIRNVWNEGKEI